MLGARTVLHAADQVYDARGFDPNRAFFSQLPYEHIDPLTGNLLLTFTDLILPGDAGFDLKIQRTYNSKILRDYNLSGGTLAEDSWAGVGWTLHFGRVFHPFSNDATPPVIEMADGSQHPTYHPVAVSPGCSACFITRDGNASAVTLGQVAYYAYALSEFQIADHDMLPPVLDGGGGVTYHVAANPTALPRTATLTIGGQTVTITQDGQP